MEKDWRITHRHPMGLWTNKQPIPLDHGPQHDQETFDEYLCLLHRSM